MLSDNSYSRNKKNMKMVSGLWLIFAFFIVYGTVIPFNFISIKETFLSNINKIEWIGSSFRIPDVMQNVLLFVPFGFLGFFSIKQVRLTRILIVTLLGVTLSLTVETLQLFTIDRTTAVSDLLCNTLGSFLGALIASTLSDSISNAFTLPLVQRRIHTRFFFPFLVSFIIIILGSLHPFDFTLDLGFFVSKLRSLLNNPFDLNPVLKDEMVAFLRFFIFSFLCTLTLWEWNHRYHVAKGVVFSCLLGLFLEACQIVILSRMPGVQDAIVVISGSLCGGLFYEYWPWLFSRNKWAILVIITTWLAAMVQSLSPFRYTIIARGMNWFPFLPYYERTSFIALANFLESALIYYPMGFILQYLLPKKKRPYLFIGLITVGLAFPLELAQGWVAGRYPDITDVIGAVIGAISGAWTCKEGWSAFNRHIGKEPNTNVY